MGGGGIVSNLSRGTCSSMHRCLKLRHSRLAIRRLKSPAWHAAHSDYKAGNTSWPPLLWLIRQLRAALDQRSVDADLLWAADVADIMLIALSNLPSKVFGGGVDVDVEIVFPKY
jgi:hypothetical protein